MNHISDTEKKNKLRLIEASHRCRDCSICIYIKHLMNSVIRAEHELLSNRFVPSINLYSLNATLIIKQCNLWMKNGALKFEHQLAYSK